MICLNAHLSRVPSLTLKVLPKLQILRRDRILADVRQQEKGQEAAEDTQTAADEERILAAPNAVRATGGIVLNNGEQVCTWLKGFRRLLCRPG